MAAYSKAVADGGNAATMLRDMAPKPVKAEEDPEGMADFIEDMSDKTQRITTKEINPVNNENVMVDDPDSQGANFAAMFSQEII